MIEAPAFDTLTGDRKIVSAWMRADVDVPSFKAYMAASKRLEKAGRAPAPAHESLRGDAQIVGAWMRGDDHGPSPQDYIAASKRLEEAGEAGRETEERQMIIDGDLDPI